MFTFEVNEKSINTMVLRFLVNVDKNVKQALDDIRTEWGYEIFRQQIRFHRGKQWVPLTTEYAARKQADYSDRGQTGVKYNTTLRRTGRMLEGYRDGITLNQLDNSVTMPYTTEYSRVHQLGSGGTNAGHGKIPARPFNVGGFHQIAIDRFREAIRKSLNAK